MPQTFRPDSKPTIKWGKRALAIQLAAYGQHNNLPTSWLKASLDAIMEGESGWVGWLRRNDLWTAE